MNDSFVIPNAGFIYISDNNVANDLLNLAIEKNLSTLIEEFTLYSFANTTLDSYIETHHPTCLYGKSNSENYSINNSINDYVDSKLNMNIYFEHN